MRKPWLVVMLLGCCTSALAAQLQLYTEEYRPLSFYDNGKLTGMAVEVAEQLMQRTGTSAAIHVVPWTRGYHQVQHEANSGLFPLSARRGARRCSSGLGRLPWVTPASTHGAVPG